MAQVTCIICNSETSPTMCGIHCTQDLKKKLNKEVAGNSNVIEVSVIVTGSTTSVMMMLDDCATHK